MSEKAQPNFTSLGSRKTFPGGGAGFLLLAVIFIGLLAITEALVAATIGIPSDSNYGQTGHAPSSQSTGPGLD